MLLSLVQALLAPLPVLILLLNWERRLHVRAGNSLSAEQNIEKVSSLPAEHIDFRSVPVDCKEVAQADKITIVVGPLLTLSASKFYSIPAYYVCKEKEGEDGHSTNQSHIYVPQNLVVASFGEHGYVGSEGGKPSQPSIWTVANSTDDNQTIANDNGGITATIAEKWKVRYTKQIDLPVDKPQGYDVASAKMITAYRTYWGDTARVPYPLPRYYWGNVSKTGPTVALLDISLRASYIVGKVEGEPLPYKPMPMKVINYKRPSGYDLASWEQTLVVHVLYNDPLGNGELRLPFRIPAFFYHLLDKKDAKQPNEQSTSRTPAGMIPKDHQEVGPLVAIPMGLLRRELAADEWRDSERQKSGFFLDQFFSTAQPSIYYAPVKEVTISPPACKNTTCTEAVAVWYTLSGYDCLAIPYHVPAECVVTRYDQAHTLVPSKLVCSYEPGKELAVQCRVVYDVSHGRLPMEIIITEEDQRRFAVSGQERGFVPATDGARLSLIYVGSQPGGKALLPHRQDIPFYYMHKRSLQLFKLNNVCFDERIQQWVFFRSEGTLKYALVKGPPAGAVVKKRNGDNGTEEDSDFVEEEAQEGDRKKATKVDYQKLAPLLLMAREAQCRHLHCRSGGSSRRESGSSAGSNVNNSASGSNGDGN